MWTATVGIHFADSNLHALHWLKKINCTVSQSCLLTCLQYCYQNGMTFVRHSRDKWCTWVNREDQARNSTHLGWNFSLRKPDWCKVVREYSDYVADDLHESNPKRKERSEKITAIVQIIHPVLFIVLFKVRSVTKLNCRHQCRIIYFTEKQNKRSDRGHGLVTHHHHHHHLYLEGSFSRINP